MCSQLPAKHQKDLETRGALIGSENFSNSATDKHLPDFAPELCITLSKARTIQDGAPRRTKNPPLHPLEIHEVLATWMVEEIASIVVSLY